MVRGKVVLWCMVWWCGGEMVWWCGGVVVYGEMVYGVVVYGEMVRW